MSFLSHLGNTAVRIQRRVPFSLNADLNVSKILFTSSSSISSNFYPSTLHPCLRKIYWLIKSRPSRKTEHRLHRKRSNLADKYPASWSSLRACKPSKRRLDIATRQTINYRCVRVWREGGLASWWPLPD